MLDITRSSSKQTPPKTVDSDVLWSFLVRSFHGDLNIYDGSRRLQIDSVPCVYIGVRLLEETLQSCLVPGNEAKVKVPDDDRYISVRYQRESGVVGWTLGSDHISFPLQDVDQAFSYLRSELSPCLDNVLRLPGAEHNLILAALWRSCFSTHTGLNVTVR